MKLRHAIILCFLSAATAANAQSDEPNTSTGQINNYIPTGMPILQIAPDAISGAMGDAGVASQPDAYSSHWNCAKFAFAPNAYSISTTYTPWLRKLDKEMNFLYVGGYYRLGNRSTVGASLTFFSLGKITHTDDMGNNLGEFNPNEYAFDLSYAMKLTEHLSLGATGRFVHSDLTQGMVIEDQTTKAANGLAADVGLYYENEIDKKQSYALGLLISNLGSKLSYSDDDTDNEFLPANLRIGGRYSYEVDQYNKFSFMLDLNKLLVPTPPIKIDNGDGTYSYEGSYENMNDYNQTSSFAGMFKSFNDAPGGLKEELHEITVSLGGEYWYNDIIAVRAGYFYEHKTKGGRQYLTFGAGIKYNRFCFDLSYLFPTTDFSNNPLANTLRVGITFNADNKKK